MEVFEISADVDIAGIIDNVAVDIVVGTAVVRSAEQADVNNHLKQPFVDIFVGNVGHVVAIFQDYFNAFVISHYFRNFEVAHFFFQ